MERIVVPFTSVDAADAVSDLAGRRATEVVAVAIDVGQAVPLDELRDVALAAGALRCHVFELRDRLAERFLWPALRAGALGVAGEPVVTALSAPCVAEATVEVARLEHATAVAAAAASARVRQRLLAALRDLSPDLGVVAVRGAAGLDEERNLWARVRPLDSRPARRRPTDRAPAAARAGALAGHHRARDAGGAEPRGDAAGGDRRQPGDHRPGPGDWRPRSPTAAPAARPRWLVQAPAAVALHRACAAVAAPHARRRGEDVRRRRRRGLRAGGARRPLVHAAARRARRLCRAACSRTRRAR